MIYTMEGVSARRVTHKTVPDRVQPIEVGKFMKHKYVFLPVYKLQWNAHTSTNIGADLQLDRAP